MRFYNTVGFYKGAAAMRLSIVYSCVVDPETNERDYVGRPGMKDKKFRAGGVLVEMAHAVPGRKQEYQFASDKLTLHLGPADLQNIIYWYDASCKIRNVEVANATIAPVSLDKDGKPVKGAPNAVAAGAKVVGLSSEFLQFPAIVHDPNAKTDAAGAVSKNFRMEPVQPDAERNQLPCAFGNPSDKSAPMRVTLSVRKDGSNKTVAVNLTLSELHTFMTICKEALIIANAMDDTRLLEIAEDVLGVVNSIKEGIVHVLKVLKGKVTSTPTAASSPAPSAAEEQKATSIPSASDPAPLAAEKQAEENEKPQPPSASSPASETVAKTPKSDDSEPFDDNDFK